MKPYRTPLPIPKHSRSFALLILMTLLLATTTAHAQYRQWVDTTLPPIKKPYGVGESEFLLGSYKIFYGEGSPITDLWDYYSSVGINTVLLAAPPEYRKRFDSFLLATNRPQNGRVIVAAFWKIIEATSAREIEFYPFDSSQSRKWGYNECLALSYDDDNLQRNINYDHRPLEAIYDTADAGTLALGDIAYNYRPAHIYPYRIVPTDTSWRAVSPDSLINRWQLSFDPIGQTYYIALTGHLFENGQATNATNLFRIEVWNEINRGVPYTPIGGSTRSDTFNQALLYHTLYVTKADLLPTGQNYNTYRTVSFPIDLDRCDGCMSGPLRHVLHDSLEYRQFNIKVYYQGGEKVALRSVAIRDSIAEMMIGSRTESVAYRDSLLDSLTALLRNSDGSLRTQIMTIYGKDEPRYEYFAGARELNKMLRANFNIGGDSLTTETALAVPHHQDLGTSNTLWWETYVNEPFDKTAGWKGSNLADRFGVDLDSQPPALKEHNGGRFTIPEMFSLANVLTTPYDTLERKINSFNEMYNQMYWGRYTPYEPEWPYNNRKAYELGLLARLARERGKRLFILPGIVRWFKVTEAGDTVASRQQEPSELRMLLGMDLCYGATGLLYYVTNASTNFYPDGKHFGEHCCWETPGPVVSDTLVDIGDITVSDQHESFHDTIHSLYVGYRNRTREMRQMNAWIGRLGPTLASLRWRDSYSMNFQARRPNKDLNATPRPLPASEIITEVTSRPRWDTVKDAAHETYVEIGLFDTKRGKTNGQFDAKKDTNYVFITNRRTFETPSTVALTTAQKQRLDSLSESRVISLKWNLQEGGDQFLFVRVQEVAPDTVVYLPGDSQPRHGLDTIIPALGGMSQIVLRPGGSALLRATFMPPAEAITGRLDYNNQHKMIYYKPPTSSWGRYYAVYYKDTALYNPDIPDSLNPYRTTWTFLRRSLPVDTTGVIRWEPVEYPLPIAAGSTRIQNLHPALTLTPMGNNVVATVVWTCHSMTASDTFHREVVLRNVAFDNSSPIGSMAWIEHVEDYVKNNLNNPSYELPWTTWGTPVIARLDSGFAILYSDAWAGIVATIRKRPAGSSWWLMPGVYSSSTQVSSIYTGPRLAYGRFPTVPSFAHVGNRDSTIGFAWVQPIRQSYGGRQEIMYGRLAQGRDPFNPSIPSVEVSSQTLRRISFGDERDYFPSMDQTQDPYGRIQEVVVWESPSDLGQFGLDLQTLNIRSIWVEKTPGSVFGYPWLWGVRTSYVSSSMDYGALPIYATIASLNDMSEVSSPDNYNAFFSLAWHNSMGTMRQGKFRYTEDFFEHRHQTYLHGGRFPQASTSEQRQVGKQGVLYQSSSTGDNPALRTTREFFARSAPTDYMAEGREITFAVDDSCLVRGSMFNPWFANDQTSSALSLVARDSTYRRIDSLPQARSLFRTVNFQSHDSTRVSISLAGAFIGPDTIGRRLWMITELMDSATDAAVYRLDSFSLSSSLGLYQRIVDTTFDLLSRTYYLRVRIDTAQVIVPTASYDSRYLVVELSGVVADGGLGKLRREGAANTAQARIDAQPNPFTGRTELRFSIPNAGLTTVRVFDPLGRPVAEVVPEQWMEVGRYAVEFDGSQLQPGTYLVELMLDQRRVVQKLVLAR